MMVVIIVSSLFLFQVDMCVLFWARTDQNGRAAIRSDIFLIDKQTISKACDWYFVCVIFVHACIYVDTQLQLAYDAVTFLSSQNVSLSDKNGCKVHIPAIFS